MRRVDAHVHLWDLDERAQPWTERFPALHRSFLLPELEKLLADHGIDAAIVVQAGDSEAETRDLLALAAASSRIVGVVGWADLTAPDVAAQLDRLRQAPGGGALVGIRHQLQLEPEPGWLGREDVRAALTAVADAGLAYDVVVSPGQLPLVIDTVRALPRVRFVLDHAGKPAIASGDLDGWRADLALLAEHANVAVKLSGLVTEADWRRWTQDELAPVAAHVLASFGADRVMAGSDWPVCLLAADYAAVQRTVERAVSGLSPADRNDVLGGTASQWYRVSG